MIKIIVAVAALAISSTASGEDWWSVASGVNDMDLAADVSRLTCRDGLCSLWERSRYAHVQPDKTAALEDHVDYDCVSGSTRTLEETRYSKDGSRLASVTGPGPWRKVEPGTMGAASFLFACGVQKFLPQALAAGVIEFGGRRYTRSTSLAAQDPKNLRQSRPRVRQKRFAPILRPAIPL